jgi:fumarate hydratase class I
VEFDGRRIVKIEPETLYKLVKEAFSDISFFLRSSHLQKLSGIISDQKATQMKNLLHII